jgi:hypothetical protein
MSNASTSLVSNIFVSERSLGARVVDKIGYIPVINLIVGIARIIFFGAVALMSENRNRMVQKQIKQEQIKQEIVRGLFEIFYLALYLERKEKRSMQQDEEVSSSSFAYGRYRYADQQGHTCYTTDGLLLSDFQIQSDRKRLMISRPSLEMAG